MGQPRASRRKVVPVSSDEDDEATQLAQPTNDDGKEASKSAAKGRLKSIRKAGPRQSTPTASAQDAQTLPQKPQTRKTKIAEGENRSSPDKKKSTRNTHKDTSQEESKPKAKPIYSFFNAATQRQQSSESSSATNKPSTPLDEAETIDSEDDNASTLELSKGSSVALAMRKRKTQHHPNAADETSLLPRPTQKFRKTSDGGRTPSISVANEDKRPWVVQFGPSNLDELAVHKRKVADVRNWLQAAYAGKRQRVLVLKGAAGTAKTTTIELLAKDIGAQVTEWKNPAGSDLTSEGSMSVSAQFEDFLGRAGKSDSLALAREDGSVIEERNSASDNQTAADKQLLLVEEFPNTFSRSSPALHSFRSALSQYLVSRPVSNGTPTPVILVVSETLLSTSTAAADSFTAHRLLGPELLNNAWLDTIEFNAIAPTILTKALEGIVVKEARRSGRRTTPGPLVLKRLAETGDIRSAVSSLEFLCLRGDDGDAWSSKVSFTKPKRAKGEVALTKAEEEALKLISNRENSLGIFHSVGKVVYNKRQEPAQGVTLAHPPPWLPQHRRNKVPETDIDRLIDELGTDTTTYIAALHENYALSCTCSSSEDTLDSISGCIDSISDADLLSLDRFSLGTRAFSGSAMDTLRQDEMSFQAAVRGVMFNLPCPVHRSASSSGKRGDAHHMFYPTSLKLWRRKEELDDTLDLLASKMQKGDFGGSTKPKYDMGGPSGGSGVAGWKRETNDSSSDLDRAATVAPAKAEMLLEHLPYMACILESSSSSSPSLDQILSVARIRGSTAPPTDNEDDIDAAADGEGHLGEQWATDKPDTDVPDRLRGTKAKRKPAAGVKTEGGGLGIPVESQVEKLVLEDDDIVDD